jgi:HK97 family phage portal protein
MRLRFPFTWKIQTDEIRQPIAGVLDQLSPNTRRDYAKDTLPMANSAVSAGVGWFARTFPEAPLAVFDEVDGQQEIIPGHELTDLIRHPNPFYPGVTLLMATIVDFLVTGNAYIIKGRSPQGTPETLWYTPSSLMEPKRPDNGSEFLSHYNYHHGRGVTRLDSEDVIHLRDGIDPGNTLRGRSRLTAVLREIWTDDEASNFTASLLANMGVPGVILSPDGPETIDEEDRNVIRRAWMNTFGRDKRGALMVGSGKTKVQVLSWNPEQMNLETIRAVPEARIAAALGIPAAIIGFLTGMRSTAVGATMAELREMAYESGIIPVQRQISELLDLQLMADFARSSTEHIGFDLRQVRVLQDDQNEMAERVGKSVSAGILKVTDAQRMLGFPVDDTQDGYLRNIMTTTLVRSEDAAETSAFLEDGGDDGEDAKSDYLKLIESSGD